MGFSLSYVGVLWRSFVHQESTHSSEESSENQLHTSSESLESLESSESLESLESSEEKLTFSDIDSDESLEKQTFSYVDSEESVEEKRVYSYTVSKVSIHRPFKIFLDVCSDAVHPL